MAATMRPFIIYRRFLLILDVHHVAPCVCQFGPSARTAAPTTRGQFARGQRDRHHDADRPSG
jgi:hypothetical protein